MADILKISTPLIDKAPLQPNRPVADPSVPFNLSDVTKVIQTNDPSEILQQNTGYLPQEEAPRILTDLLKDPAVTVSLIRNITVLQEVLQLIPGTNASLTQEIQQLFDNLLLDPEQIVPELMRQEENTTLFRGELFDQLRTLLDQSVSAGRGDMATSIGVLLKSLNAVMSRRDALDSVANNLTYLGDKLAVSPVLSERIETLIAELRQPDAGERLPELKEQVFALLRDVESSVLFTPHMEKILPLIVYNLSRYNDNDDFLPDALRLLLSTMDGDAAKEQLVNNLQNYLEQFTQEGVQPESAATLAAPLLDENGQPVERLLQEALHPELEELPKDEKIGMTLADGARAARAAEEDSQVMDTIAKIIGRQAKSEDIQLLGGDKLEKIIHSLLSSPSNFTPLLHFIVPVEYMDMRAFAEIWIDPDPPQPEDPRRGAVQGDASHLLMVFDVEDIGRFESELFVQGKRIALNLLCPPAYVEVFKGVGPAIRQAVSSTGYSFETINIDRLERTHSLMEVFTDLPHKRTGIDVKV